MLKISKKWQKCRKTGKNRQKYRKNGKTVEKPGKHRQKYRKIVKMKKTGNKPSKILKNRLI